MLLTAEVRGEANGEAVLGCFPLELRFASPSRATNNGEPSLEPSTRSQELLDTAIRTHHSAIARDSDIMGGAAVFAGTRVPVQTFFEYLTGSHPLDDFLADFPSVTREHAVDVLQRAKHALIGDEPR